MQTPKTTLIYAACSFAAILAGTLHGATITFESPYTVGNLSASTNGGTTDAPFTGQQGWSLSTADDTGGIIATSTSGEYVGGQAMYAPSGSASGARTYAGGQLGNVSTTGANTITFDTNYYSNSTIMASFFGGTNPDLDQNDAGIQFGFSATEMLQIRYAGFGSQFGIGVSAGSAGVVNGDWLRYSITIGEEVSGSRDFTVGLRNLTDGVDIDLNGAATGLLYTDSATAAEIGVAPEDARGGYLRLSGAGTTAGFVDNLTYTAVPEPSSVALLAMGLGALLASRRRMAQ